MLLGVDLGALGRSWRPRSALAGIAVTGLFLVWDLKQPKRALYLFLQPQWRSWLALGAQCINVAAVGLWRSSVRPVAALLGADDGARRARVGW